MKFEWNVNRVTEETAAHGNVWWALGTQPEKLSELININEESGCDEKNDDVSEEVTLAKKKNHFTLKELSENIAQYWKHKD